MTDWLPPLCLLTHFGSDWQRYEDNLYALFRRDFLISPLRVGGRIVHVHSVPYTNGKEAAFWHLITEDEEVARGGSVDKERLPNLRRCERICWPGAILREGEGPRVVVWRERRRDGLRLVYTLRDFSYLVSLAVRGGGTKLVLATAFPVDEPYRRDKLRKQYERYLRTADP